MLSISGAISGFPQLTGKFPSHPNLLWGGAFLQAPYREGRFAPLPNRQRRSYTLLGYRSGRGRVAPKLPHNPFDILRNVCYAMGMVVTGRRRRRPASRQEGT